MNNQTKKEIINEIMLNLYINNEIFKSLGLINDYNLKIEQKNYSFLSNGELEYDVYINQTIIPKQTVNNITINITIPNIKLN